jgi:diguanylate cyclase (GGDEF)-like protein
VGAGAQYGHRKKLNGCHAPGGMADITILPYRPGKTRAGNENGRRTLKFYSHMASLKWPASFQGKIFLVCFVSTHIPLLSLLAFFAVRSEVGGSPPVLAIATLATLLGTGLAFVAMAAMMEPIRRSSLALSDYLERGDFPDLPTGYGDEAGLLMTNVQRAVATIDRQVGRLADVALTDDMTGARNRRWLNAYGIPMFEDYKKAGKSFGLLVIDLDKFKAINDTHGHTVGDQVILATADIIRVNIRATDHLVRTGGDEFCVLMPSAGGSDVALAAERLRKAAGQSLRGIGLDQTVTVSIGAANLHRQDSGFLDTYRRADAYLYKAKQDGRNMAAVAS